MPLEIEADTKSLYDVLKSDEKIKIGELFLGEEEPVTSISSNLIAQAGEYTIETFVTPHTDHDRLPFEKLAELLKSDYTIPAKSKIQVVAKKSDNVFVYERKGRFNLVLSTTAKAGTKEAFNNVFEEYGKVLKACIDAHFSNTGRECPDAIYFLKRFRKNEYKPQSGSDYEQLERKISISNPCVEFEDIGGCVAAKREMLRIYADIKNPERAKFFGRDPSQKRGYLLLGEAGTGKTLLVKALATKLMRELGDKIKVFVVNYQDITSIFRGGEAIATGRVFELVKRNENEGLNTLLFLDEIHLIGSRSQSHSCVKDEALDTLLAHLDGIKDYRGLTVIGATYMPVEKLDPALVRDGRLSRWIIIEKLTPAVRKEIFKIYIEKRRAIAESAGNTRLFADLDLDRIARASEGFNGSHICGLVESVVDWKYDAAKDLSEFKPITTSDFLKAIKNYVKVKRLSST